MHLPTWAFVLPYLSAIVVGGIPTFIGGWRAIRTRNLDTNALMTIAIFGAVGLREWAEAAAVVCLFAIGNLFLCWGEGGFFWSSVLRMPLDEGVEVGGRGVGWRVGRDVRWRFSKRYRSRCVLSVAS